MARNIKQFDLLISCPGDAENYVDIIKEVVDDFNQQFSDTLGINIRWRYWKESAYAESGGEPQELLNKQIVDTSDLAVSVFKNKFGSPTGKYGSGTEEEIEKMLFEGRQVFVFFDESPVKIQDVDMNEHKKIQEFKERYKDRGIFWTFSNESDFKKMLNAHIIRYFMNLSDDFFKEGKSNIEIRSYKNGKIEEEIQFSLFDMGGLISSEKLFLQIRDIIKQVNDIKLEKSNICKLQGLELLMGKKVKIESDTINIIKCMADALGIILNEDFFDIGDLRESLPNHSLLLGGRNINGTKEEKEKYNAIIRLEKIIFYAQCHMQMEEYYKDIYGMKLLLCNDGSRFDEDIDVEIVIPKDRYIGVEELSVPTEKIDLGDDLFFENIFEISSTKDFIRYSDIIKPHIGEITKYYPPSYSFSESDYEKEYKDTLRDIFGYQVYSDGYELIIKIHFDYVKQHQRVAFPTWIFINRPDEELFIKYSITTKNNKDIIKKKIQVKPYKDL